MNYYPHHLGDYSKDTAHLTMIEHGAYRILLDRYYVTEQGIPADQVYRIARARTDDERAAVDVVLDEFFRLVDGVWINSRAEEEIAKAQAKISAAKENGKKGGRPQKVDRCSSSETNTKPNGFFPGYVLESEIKAHQAPTTNSQSPLTNKPTTPPTPQGVEPDPFSIFWDAYPKKVNKQATKKAFAKLKQPQETLPVILKALEWQRQSEQWTKDGTNYVPNPATYLNNARWEDEPQPIASKRRMPAPDNFEAINYGEGISPL